LPDGAVVMDRKVPTSALVTPILPQRDLAIWIDEDLSIEQSALLAKMLSAMGLDPNNSVTGKVDEIQTSHFQCILNLTQDSTDRGVWSSEAQPPQIASYPLRDLLKKPELKREAWLHLQVIIKNLGLKPKSQRDRK